MTDAPRLEARATIADAAAGDVIRFSIACRVLEGRLVPGDAIRVELPRSWHIGPYNAAKRVQATDAGAPNYVSARTSAPGAAVACAVEDQSDEEFVKARRTALDGSQNRYVFVARASVERGEVGPGDEIVFDYGRSGPGFEAGWYDEGEQNVAIEARLADGRVAAAAEPPRIRVRPSAAVELVAYLPSIGRPGENAVLRVLALDRHGNRTRGPLRVALAGIDGPAAAASQTLDLDAGAASGTVSLTGEGVVRLHLAAGELRATSNPLLVRAAPSPRIFWGDLHSHAADSFDGAGSQPFAYARDISCLDFYALTEHTEVWREGAWERIAADVARYHAEGSFVTLRAYEATFPAPWGHHNVYFRDTDGPVFGALSGTLLDLWQLLARRDALTVPHHTGVRFLRRRAGTLVGTASVEIDWSHHDAELRRLVEIYSAHGQSELFDPTHPLAYERSDFQFNGSAAGPHYAQDAWRLGLRLGTLASSDDHHGRPGQGAYGLAAVMSTQLTRHGIFDALRDRHCYGTTGARMIVEFEAAGSSMGRETVCDGPVPLRVRVHGTADLAAVEVVRVARDTAPEVVACWSPNGPDLVAASTTEVRDTEAAFYLRAYQRAPYRGRRVQAWSSPVWVTRSRGG